MITRKVIIGTLLLAAPFFVGTAQALDYTIQSTPGGTVTGSALSSTNSASVTGGGSTTGSTTISAGAGNNIGSSAVGASSSASIDVSIPATNIVTAPGAASTVNAATITGTNSTGGTVLGAGSFAAPVITTGLGNSITSQAIGAAAGSSITFRAQ